MRILYLFTFSLPSSKNQVNAIDKDFGEYGQLTYDIFSDEMKEFFSIDKTKGEIITKVRLDREVQKMYEVPVIATDGGGRSGFTTVKIRVGDQNDKTPQFYLREYKTSIYGNLSVNATFLHVSFMWLFLSSFLSLESLLLGCFFRIYRNSMLAAM